MILPLKEENTCSMKSNFLHIRVSWLPTYFSTEQGGVHKREEENG